MTYNEVQESDLRSSWISAELGINAPQNRYYRPTAMGRGILEHGVEELMRREREFNDTYS